MAAPAHLSADYRPSIPSTYRPGVGIVGCGNIVRSAHLKAYEKWDIHVVGIYDIVAEAARQAQERFGVLRIFESLDELLGHPEIEVVDIATHPEQRVPLVIQALEAGKHVLAQKPLALTVEDACQVVDLADRLGLKIAVNQNGRWAPAWRIATLLIEQGTIGDILAVTHLYDMKFGWIPGTHFDTMPHFAIYDYSIHWIDIIRCWMAARRPLSVRARDYRTPNQPAESKTPWGMWIEVGYDEGANAMIRGIGCAEKTERSHPFWIHGTTGTIRGSVLGKDFVELEKDGAFCRYQLEGQWFPDGFAGTMGELLWAIAEEREPYNSARHNLLSLEMTLAAVQSAAADGKLMPVGGYG